METLHLNLKKKWFDMIKSCIKKHEYREITTYWCSRLLLWDGEHKKPEFYQRTFQVFEIGKSYHLTIPAIELLESLFKTGLVTYKSYNKITFSNGMTPPVPRFTISRENIFIGKGYEEWGAVKDEKYFVQELGRLIA